MILKKSLSILLIILGNAIVAFGVCFFVLPKGLIMGGGTGLSLIANHFWNFDIAIVTYVINILFFIVAFIFKGKKFALGIIISTLTFPAFLWIFKSIPGFRYTGEDMMLAAIFAGVLIGLGGGLIIRNGSSSGGIEVLHIIVSEKTGINLALIINVVDIFILGIQAFFSTMDQILYGIILTCVLSLVLNRVLLLGEKKAQVTIISPEYKKIRDVITQKLDLGCTFLDISTGYSNVRQQAVMCVLTRRKLSALHAEILSIDSKAFIVTAEINNVKGRGFSLPKIKK